MVVTAKRMRYGTYKEDGTLDYGVYCEESRAYEMSPDGSKYMLKADLVGETDVDSFCRFLYLALPRECLDQFNDWYCDIPGGRTDVICADIGDSWTFLRYVSGGSWFAFARGGSFDDRNQLTYKDKSRLFALWDNARWYSPIEDITGNWDFDEIRRHMQERGDAPARRP